MHRIAIGDPQCVCHELFAQLRIRMVDGESVWQQFYPHASGSLGSSGCGHCRCLVEVWNCVHVDISSRQRIGSARGSATREAIVRRSEPLQLQLWVRISPAIAPKRPLSGRAMGVLQIARWWNSAPDLPDVSKCFRRDSSKHPCQRHHATLHGVVFDILVGSENHVGSAVPVPQPGAARTPIILISSFCLSMILSENRFPLFRIMLY